MNKISPRNELKATVDRLKREGKKVVFTNGCFDILHAGHTRYLREARKMGDALILALNSDSSVRSIKGPMRPIVPEAERAEVVASLDSVDYVTIFDELTPLELIEFLRPDVIVKGGTGPRRTSWAPRPSGNGADGWPSCQRSKGPRRRTSSTRSSRSTVQATRRGKGAKYFFTKSRLFVI